MGDAGVNDGNKFPIPPEYRAALRFAPRTETQTNEEILKELNTFRPVTSERNVWAFWHSGLLSMPEWQKRNICDWVRINGPRWTVRVLDDVPDSPNYALKYVSPELLPACFVQRTMAGQWTGQHSADFLRGAALWQHGGCWSDIGQILLTTFDRICWDQLENPDTPYTVCAPWMAHQMIANWFVASRKGDPFIKHWHDIFVTTWEGRTSCEGISAHPLIKGTGLDLNSTEMTNERFPFELKVEPHVAYEYVTQIVCWIRTCLCEGNAEDPFNGVEYWQKHVLLYDALEENFGAESILGFPEMGPKLFKLLKTRTDLDPESEEHKRAQEVIWRVLTKSSTQKVARGKNLFKTLNLGSFWDMPENVDCDREPGTYAEMLRYGSMNFVQTRDSVMYVPAPVPVRTLKKGCLEP